MSRTQLLRAWVSALESGKYTQTQGTLRSNDGFCCLGVACDVSGAGKWLPIADALCLRVDEYGAERQPECSESTHMFNGAEIALPSPLLYKLGLTPEQERQLQTMNDEYGATFPQIAQRIREWFPEAFATVEV